MSTATRCRTAAVAFVCSAVYFLYTALSDYQAGGKLSTCLYVLSTALCCSLSYAFYVISTRRPPANISILAAFKMYIALNIVLFITWLFRRRLLKNKMNVEKTQQNVLLSILKRTKNTSYVRENGIDKITSVKTFRATHPLATYAHFKPWVDRILNGEQNVFIPENTDYVAVTSGTTSGKSKHFPKNVNVYLGNIMNILPFFWTCLRTETSRRLQYALNFKFGIKTTSHEYGIKKGALTSMSTDRGMMAVLTPLSALYIVDMNTAFYVNLVFNLRTPDLGLIIFSFGSQVYAFFRFLENNWPAICEDIRKGRICDTVREKDPEIIDGLNKELRPEPERADELIREFEKGFQNIILRIWPNASCIVAIFTGPFAVYRTALKERYLGNVELRSFPHMATEGIYGINIWENVKRCDEFLPCYGQNFYEFIPESEITSEKPQSLLLHQLEYGERYEMVVTTKEGLYRYRTNDVVTVAGFEGSVPTYTFAQRADDNVSVFAEKTPLCVLCEVTEGCFGRWKGQSLVEYTVVESIHVNLITGGSDKCYMILVEMCGDDLTPKQITELDTCLQDNAQRYHHYRHLDHIQEIQLIRVRDGAFSELRTYILSCNPEASVVQVKIPRKATRDDHLRVLLGV